jgi:hypothetical protein
VGNICLSNELREADVLLTHAYSFEIQSTDPFQIVSWNTVQSYGSTWWPMQSLRGKPSTRETTNRSRCGICNLTSSVHQHFTRYSLRTPYKTYLYPLAYMNERKRRKLNTEVTVVNGQNLRSWFRTMLVHLASIWRDHHHLICYWLTSCSAVLRLKNPLADYTSSISITRWSMCLK